MLLNELMNYKTHYHLKCKTTKGCNKGKIRYQKLKIKGLKHDDRLDALSFKWVLPKSMRNEMLEKWYI